MESVDQIFHGNERYKKLEQSKDSPRRLNISEVEVDRVADWLESELHGGERSRAFYCKTARIFPRAYLTNLVSRAQREGRNPNKLFIFLVRNEMTKRGIK